MAAGTETEHARSVLHCVLHLFLNSKQRMKLETVNSDGIYFRSWATPAYYVGHFSRKLREIEKKKWNQRVTASLGPP